MRDIGDDSAAAITGGASTSGAAGPEPPQAPSNGTDARAIGMESWNMRSRRVLMGSIAGRGVVVE